MFKIRYRIFLLFVLLLCISSSVYAPIDTINEPENNSGIKIISQDYIDSQFDWRFTKIDEKTYFAEFTMKESFANDVKSCILTSESNPCWDGLNNNYLDAKESKTKVSEDLKNMENYPLLSMTEGITFSKFNYDSNKMSGNFYIYIEDTEKEYMAKFGFGSTIISISANSNPWFNNGRQICVDGSGIIHTTWNYNDTLFIYSRSTNQGIDWQTQNITVSYESTTVTPAIGCSGNNVVWGVVDGSTYSANLNMMISNNSGETFTRYFWGGNCANDYFNIEVRGNRVYANCRDIGSNKTDFYQGWVNGTLGFEKLGILEPIPTKGCNRPTMSVVGTGTASDKIYASCIEVITSNDPYFAYSNDAGATWSANTTITSTNTYIGRLVGDSTQLYYVGVANSVYTNVAITIYNSSDAGLTWTAANLVINDTPTQRFLSPSISFIQSNLPCVIYETINTTGISEKNISYICKNTTTTWGKKMNTGLVNVSLPSSPSQYFNDGKLHFIFQNQTPSPDVIGYDYVKPLGKNMIVIDNGGTEEISIGNEIFSYAFGSPSAPAADIIPPTYSSNSTNSTSSGTPIEHRLKWDDTVSLSGYIFQFCNGTWTDSSCTGSLVNDSWVSMTGLSSWSNVTKTIGFTLGMNYSWCVYANDSSNNWNSTSCINPFTYSTSLVYPTGYTKCKNITINNGFGSTLYNFPVNLNITYDSDMQSGFDDLRFYSSYCGNTGELLYTELESKTDSTMAYTWSKIPTLSTGNNIISVYYGNPTASSNWDDGTNVWDEGYVLVMHLNDSHDSSKYKNNGLVQGATQVVGKWGNSYTFNGLTNMINITNSRSLNITLNITIEALVYPIYYIAGSYPRIVQKESATTATPYGLDLTPSNTLGVFTNASGEYGVSSALNTVPIGKWTGVGTKYSGVSTAYTYVNGTVNATGNIPGPMVASNNNIRLGNNPASTRALNGTLDEVRISNVSRSDAWINMTFTLIDKHYSYVTYSSEESTGGTTDSCTCAGLNINWLVNMADNCVLNTDCYLGTGHLNFTGSGNFYVNATINTTGMGYPTSGETVWIRNLGVINVK